MDRKTLIEEVRRFKDRCSEKGYKLSFCALVPEMENFDDTSFVLQVSALWTDEKPCSEIFDILVPILFETTSVATREKLYRMDIYNQRGDVHCWFSDLILENEIGYDPSSNYSRIAE